MALTRVACDKEGDGDGGKSNGYEGGGRAMVTAMRVPVDKEGKGSTGHGVGNEGGM